MRFDCVLDQQKIQLKIKRTAASRKSCNHPMCGVTRSLKTIPKEKRYQIAVTEGVFIPPNTLACCNHIEIEAWKNVNAFITSEHSDFTKKNIEDMFDLLSNPPVKAGESKESSVYF